MKDKFSIPEIKEWLEGWFYCDTNRTEDIGLANIIDFLECEHDGIESYFERKEYEEKIKKG